MLAGQLSSGLYKRLRLGMASQPHQHGAVIDQCPDQVLGVPDLSCDLGCALKVLQPGLVSQYDSGQAKVTVCVGGDVRADDIVRHGDGALAPTLGTAGAAKAPTASASLAAATHADMASAMFPAS